MSGSQELKIAGGDVKRLELIGKNGRSCRFDLVNPQHDLNAGEVYIIEADGTVNEEPFSKLYSQPYGEMIERVIQKYLRNKPEPFGFFLTLQQAKESLTCIHELLSLVELFERTQTSMPSYTIRTVSDESSGELKSKAPSLEEVMHGLGDVRDLIGEASLLNYYERSNRKVELGRSTSELYIRAAEMIVQKLDAAVKRNGRAAFALSGGSTPKALYEILAGETYTRRIPWKDLLIFWSDERCVPKDSDLSNYKMAYEALLSKVPVPGENIFRMKGELDPESAAEDYRNTIRSVLGDAPNFDLVLLGVGADGHTASLFPESPALNETNKFVAAHLGDSPSASRVTLTLLTLNFHSEDILFLVSGTSKADVVKKIFSHHTPIMPAQMIKPNRGKVTWFLDKDAASKLDTTAIDKFA